MLIALKITLALHAGHAVLAEAAVQALQNGPARSDRKKCEKKVTAMRMPQPVPHTVRACKIHLEL